MKRILFVAIVMFTGSLFAQDEKPDFTKKGDMVIGTYYFDDGQVKQEGTYKDGKLHGEWVAYNKEGDKIAMAKYKNGKKTGKWFFWNDGKLLEVDYADNKITNVSKWKNSQTLVSK